MMAAFSLFPPPPPICTGIPVWCRNGGCCRGAYLVCAAQVFDKLQTSITKAVDSKVPCAACTALHCRYCMAVPLRWCFAGVLLLVHVGRVVLRRAFGAVMCLGSIQTSKEVHREANEAFEKFLQESQKRQMFFESCDYSQYDPFEKRCVCAPVPLCPCLLVSECVHVSSTLLGVAGMVAAVCMLFTCHCL
jgi:hypothetical protein